MASGKDPKERAGKKKKASAGGILAGMAAAAGAIGAAAGKGTGRNRALALVAAVLLFAVGAAGGFFAVDFFTKEDGFSMRGEDFLEIPMYSLYEEQGATSVFFGREGEVRTVYYYREDISHDAVAVDGVDTAVHGFYYAVYTSDALPYRGVELIRTIEVMRVEDDGEIQ